MPTQPLSHCWNLSAKEAVALQQSLRAQLICEDRLPAIRHVAGVDVGVLHSGRDSQGHISRIRAAIAVLSFPELELRDQSIVIAETRFPYIPGLLSFRELPAVMSAFTRLNIQPDVLLCDGQGIAHPRRMGIASHLGLLTGIASLGVGKTRLTGSYTEPGAAKGDWSPLYADSPAKRSTTDPEILGAVLRTRAGCKPLFISPGHLISLPTAIELTLACTGKYKLPETTRWAHRLASERPE